MVLLSNSQGRKVVALEGYGLNIVETRPVAIHGFTPTGTKP